MNIFKKCTQVCGAILVLAILSLCPGPALAADLLSEEKAAIEIFEKASPSVAFIKNADLKWNWYSNDVYEVPKGVGSGFVWDDQGHIITNFHVIYQADTIEVIFSDKERYSAKVVGLSPDHDLAVLKIDAPAGKLPALAIGSSQDLKVGQTLFAIGNPFGLDHSFARGVVSALGRSIRSLSGRRIHGVIQTDAAINPGNSGGPLLNSSGELVGVATAIYSPSGASAGVGFGIPVDIVKKIVPQLIQFGRVKRIGFGATFIPGQILQHLGIDGAMVLDVVPGSPADKAGLRPTYSDRLGNISYGDVILAVDGQEIRDSDELSTFIEQNKKPGDKVTLKFFRGGEFFQVSVSVQEF